MVMPLLFAVEQNSKEDVLRALKAGCNIREHTPSKSTVISSAIRRNYPLLVDLLLRHGADVDQPDAFSVGGKYPLHHAIDVGNMECAVLLLQAGASVDARDVQGFTPLHLAARRGSLPCVKLLLSKGANGEAQDNLGKTAHYWATIEGHKDCAALLPSIKYDFFEQMDKERSLHEQQFAGIAAITTPKKKPKTTKKSKKKK